MLLLLLFVAGFVLSLFAGGLGIGGGVMMVPTILYIGQLGALPEAHLPHMALASSLLAACVLSSAATASNLRSGRIRMGSAVLVVLGAIPGAFLGTRIAERLGAGVLELMIAASLLLVGVSGLAKLARERGRLPARKAATRFESESHPTRPRLLPVAGGFTGVVASVTGTGGGLIMVPVFAKVLQLGVHEAVATSSFCVVFNALFGVLFYLSIETVPSFPEPSVGYLYLPFVAPIVAGAWLGGYVGARLSARMSSSALVTTFVATHLLVGLAMLLRA